MSATEQCAAAKEHSNDAVAQIKSAADTVSEQMTQIRGILTDLAGTLSLIHGTREDAISQAAGHMSAVAETVGSSTADELAAGFLRVKDMLGNDPITGLNKSIDTLENAFTTLQGVVNSVDVDATELESLNHRVEQLAAQLGA
jgi:ABC-type transporter Mla subunit MlaD